LAIPPALGPDSRLPGSNRLQKGEGWKAIVLCGLRIKIGAAPGKRLLGDEDSSLKLAAKTASQLAKKATVPWVKSMFGADPGTGTAISSILHHDNANDKDRFGGIYASEKEGRVRAIQIKVAINERPASRVEVVLLEKALAKELAVPEWQEVSEIFVGREEDLSRLGALTKKSGALVQIVAPGGQGKTSLVRKWIGERPVFFWPFYRQGLSARSHLPIYPFQKALDQFLGLPTKDGATRKQMVKQWIAGISAKPCWIVLDGCEVMLGRTGHGPSSNFAYAELVDLLQQFPAAPDSGVILTSRVAVEVPHCAIDKIELPPLDAEWVCCIFTAYGVDLPATLRKRAIEMADGSPLLAHLLCALACDAPDRVDGMENLLNTLVGRKRSLFESLVRKRDPSVTTLAKMLWGYETMLAGTHELALLHLCSAFQREPDQEALGVLLRSVAKLRMGVPKSSPERWLEAAERLQELKLAQGEGLEISLHPLVQNYFSDSLKERKPELWSGINNVLYEHYRDSVLEDQPRDMPSIMRLFDAIVHGCQMGDPLKSYDEVAYRRVAHGYEIYPLNHLGRVHEMVAAMEAIVSALGRIHVDPQWYCGFANVRAISHIALGNYQIASENLNNTIKSGYKFARKSSDADFIGIVLFAMVHKLRLLALAGGSRASGLWTLKLMAKLGEEKAAVLTRHDAPDRTISLAEGNEYGLTHVYEYLLGRGMNHLAEDKLQTTLAEARRRLGREITLLPGLAARPHGEILVAKGEAMVLLNAVERGEASHARLLHEFSNTESHLHGLAALEVALKSSETETRRSLGALAKNRLDEAVEIASDRGQFNFEAPSRLARAEWAVGVGDARQALEDIRSVRLRAEELQWVPFQIRADLIEARLKHLRQEGKLAEEMRKAATGRASKIGFNHPWVKAHSGKQGAAHLERLAAIRLE
jgi:hypothetical protein